MRCAHCHKPIPEARLTAVPDATLCVPCLRKAGDVAAVRGAMVYDHKTGGSLELVTPAQLRQIRDLPGEVIGDRLTRL